MTGLDSRPPSANDWPSVPGYQILGELGRGGMGVVYRAWHTLNERAVALKLIRDGALASPQDRARFRIEAEAAARVRHPNVVEVYEIGECHGQPYYAMELVEGESLDRRLAGQPQPPAFAAGLIRTLALAVEQAHVERVIHRDLKPSNVLLAVDGSPKLLDFGLAKRLDSESTAWTQDGAVLGSAGYMAPEQADGRVSDIGPATDVYALGAILYEMLVGRPPFRADNWFQMIERVRRDEPTPPVRERPDVPRDLEAICLKCLEKDIGRRYPTARELADDLARFLAGTPVTAMPMGEAERHTRLARNDGFEIVGVVGRGPGGIVYRATAGPLGQAVAIKVFRTGVDSPDDWDARFRAAAQSWATLAHPQVVVPQRSGRWGDVPYLVMEYSPHGSLAGRITGRPQPIRESVALVAQLADVVGYMHRQGVVHGNLKPSNVLLAADGIPRLCDPLPAGGASSPYAAPELLDDPAAEPRVHADVFGLGAILYELLTGKPPADDPPPPSKRNREVTADLDMVCLRCLRRDPWRRYQRAYDVYTRLRDSETILPERDGRGIPKSK